MKPYPSISTNIFRDLSIYAFNKIDGSCIRSEWTNKNGFFKFGSKKRLIDVSEPILGESINIIKTQFEEPLTEIFLKNRYQKTTCYFEFHGPNSFAGQHENEPHTLSLIDVNIDKKGFMPPNDFYKTFKHLNIAKLLYTGKPNKEFELSVNNSQLEGMSCEGVVCKGIHMDKKLIMFKIKSKIWLDKLKNFCGTNKQMFSELI